MSRALFAHLVFSAVTSAMMSALVCGVATYKMVGASAAFLQVWSGAWFFAWPIGFAVLVSVGPAIRKTVYRSCKCPLAEPFAKDKHTSPPNL